MRRVLELTASLCASVAPGADEIVSEKQLVCSGASRVLVDSILEKVPRFPSSPEPRFRCGSAATADSEPSRAAARLRPAKRTLYGSMAVVAHTGNESADSVRVGSFPSLLVGAGGML